MESAKWSRIEYAGWNLHNGAGGNAQDGICIMQVTQCDLTIQYDIIPLWDLTMQFYNAIRTTQ